MKAPLFRVSLFHGPARRRASNASYESRSTRAHVARNRAFAFPASSLARSSYVVSSNTSLRLFSSYPNPRNNAFDATFSYPIFAVNVVVPNSTAPYADVLEQSVEYHTMSGIPELWERLNHFASLNALVRTSNPNPKPSPEP